MKCPTPIPIKREQGRETVPVPCGKCGACMQTRRDQWTFRIKQELKASLNAFFITLTYDDENLPEFIDNDSGEYYQTLNKSHVQNFMKEIRRRQSELTQTKIRFYAIGEYGGIFERPHYHILLFNVHKSLMTREQLIEMWKKGERVHIGRVEPASIHYVTKYHISANKKESKTIGRIPEFTLMSKGIGRQYIETNSKWHLENRYNHVIDKNHKLLMPRYYRDKIFNEEEIKTLQYESRIKGTEAHALTVKLLLELGYEDPEEYIFQNQLEQAKKVKRKKDDKNKNWW